jgi:hypothetical protein
MGARRFAPQPRLTPFKPGWSFANPWRHTLIYETSFARAPSAKLKNRRIHSCPVVYHRALSVRSASAVRKWSCESAAIPSRAPTSELNEELVKSSFESVVLCLLLAVATSRAQNQNPGQNPNQAPAPSATPPSAPAPAATSAATATSSRTPEVSSRINTGNELSFEPIYWFPRGIPVLRGGAADINTDPGNLDYTGKLKRSPGARVNFPVSKNATLRVSYFKANSYTGVTTAPVNLNLFDQAVTGGDILTTISDIEGFKLSYDYLTYFWKRGNSELRLKTLYEVQRISVSNQVDDFVVDTTGALININPIIGSQSVLLPTFGLGLEHTLSRHFRWEARGSGFGLPHRGDIVDAEAQIAFRVSHFELLGGGRWLHFKTTPRAAQYNVETMYGPYVSLRYYWKKN